MKKIIFNYTEWILLIFSSLTILITEIINKNVINGLIITILNILAFSVLIKPEVFMKKKNKKEIKEKKSTSKKRSTFWKFFRIFVYLCLIGVILAIVAFGIFCAYIVKNAPKFNPNDMYTKESSIIYDSEGNLMGKIGNENRENISYSDMPEVLIDAIIATEDSKYFQHNGLDIARFINASVKQVLGVSNAGGASTISMQVVKNTWTTTDQTITRKFTDIYLAVFKLEKKYSKEQILEYYANYQFFGHNTYGVAEASKLYFNKEVKDLNLAEAAILAGMFQAPSSYDPIKYPENAKKRQETVLYLMERHGYITEEEYKLAKAIPIDNLINENSENNTNSEYQAFIDMVAEEVEEKTGINPSSQSMKIYTTMIKSKQDYLNDIMDGTTWKWENDKVQAGIAVTNVNTGAVVAIGANRKQGAKLYNYATDIDRQIGSTAKPLFDYAPGMEYNNWSTYTPFIDEEYTYSNGKPIKNSDNGYKGFLTLKQSLGLSRNIPALKAFQQVNNKKILSFVTSLGIDPEIEGGKVHEAHSIGAFNGSNPLTMATAYAAFANGGYYIEPYTVTKVIINDTNETYTYNPTKTKVMSDSTAYMITNVLEWAVNHGLSSGAKLNGVAVAAKTGTTNFDAATIKNNKLKNSINDAWVVGYSPDYSVGFWYGYDDLDPKYYSTTKTWSIRDKFYKKIISGIFEKNGKKFKVPNSVVQVKIEKETNPAMLPSENTPDDMITTEYFKKGTVPTTVSSRYKALDNVTNLSISNNNGINTLTWTRVNTTIDSDETFGSLGYNVYTKDSSGKLNLLGFTTSPSYTHETSQSTTYIVKTVYENNKDNESSGVFVTYTVEIPEPEETPSIMIVLGNSNVTLSIGSSFTPSKADITVYENLIDITNMATISEPVIKDSNGNIVSAIDTSSPNKYTVTYTVTYSEYTETKIQTITIK